MTIGMKNFMLVQVGRYPRLFNADGVPIDLFNRFVVNMKEAQGLSESTRKGYAEHTAHMLDFMCELGMLELDNPPSPTNAQRALSLYPRFLEDATLIDDPQLAQIAQSLGRTPISKASCGKHCAAINNFSEFSQQLAQQEHALEQARGGERTPAPLPPFRPQQQARSHFEILRLQQNSVIASCINGKKLKATRRKPRLSTKVSEQTFAGKDFPRSRLIQAIKRANNSRDRLLWLMLAATGLRFSEALQMRLSDIDLKNRSMKVHDPSGARNPITQEEKRLPNKGRRTTSIYILAPLKDMLFDALEAYLHERPQMIEQDYLFLHSTPEKFGQPLCTSTPFKTLNGTCNRAFKKAQTEGDEKQHLYSLHSLRHFYATWLKNCVSAKGSHKLGLQMYQIQRLMGHKQLTTTMRYCHEDQIIIDMILEVADLSMAGQFNEVDLDDYYGSALIKYGKYLISNKSTTHFQDHINTKKNRKSSKHCNKQLEIQ
ncbi:tyrosine-type recombinase/integrase [Pseudomonas syringae]|nr:site-specific integrase [Pseudomonas syringae]WCE90964.1 site-specific integrase [Pseudomonas syringae pv. actinidiae]WOK33404.1 site-specific integrase [Pseudomonas syringae pv. actinidiae]